MQTDLVRIKQDIEELARFNATPGQGLTRFSLTKEDREAREYLKSQLKELDVEIYEDQAATLFARREGSDSDLPVIMLGSHFDSVRNGGNFDGPAGVVMALEVFRLLAENGIETRYPLEFVAMIEEEGGRFGSGLFGSRAMTGQVDYEELKNNIDEDGISMAEALRDFGFNPEEIASASRKPENIKSFLELHIEQGPLLESKDKDVGIVDYIVGIKHLNIRVSGRPDHAGTTPMEMRADAMAVASKVIAGVDKLAVAENNGTVATVGNLSVKPGATNIVPGEIQFTVDLRSKEYASIQRVKEKIETELVKLTSDNEALNYDLDEVIDIEPVEMSEEILSIFKNKAENLDFSHEEMVSGAGHDAMVMGAITDVGLIFVPSKNGRSHCPEEWTDYEDLQKGIELVYQTILELAEVVN